MDSSPTDVLMLNGVAEIVNALLEFKPVDELFHHHLQRWRKKYCLLEKQRVKVKAQLAEFWRDEPQTPDPYQAKYWPARRIYSPDRTKSGLFLIPPKLDFELRRYEGPIRRHSLRSLHKKQNFTLAESFILLAELHGAAYSQRQLGEEKEFMVGVAEATEILAIGLPQAAVVNLKALFQRVLDRIEALADSRSRNKSGKILQEIMIRSRQTLEDLVIRSRPNHDYKSEAKPVKPAAASSTSDPVVPDFAEATETVPEEYKEQGRECGPLEGGKTALAKAVTRNPKAKPDDLKKYHGGKVFVREISKRKLEVFFRSFREFNAAKELLTSANSE